MLTTRSVNLLKMLDKKPLFLQIQWRAAALHPSVGGGGAVILLFLCKRQVGYMVSTPSTHAGSWVSIPNGAYANSASPNLLFEETNTIRYIKVTLHKKQILYVILKLLFVNKERYTLYQSSVKKTNAMPSIKVLEKSECYMQY